MYQSYQVDGDNIMKIEIEDVVVDNLLRDMADEIVKAKMKEIIDDTYEYTHPEDVKYYNKLKKAAIKIYNHHSLHTEHIL